jgi:Protein of unknown function (DUF3301)
MFVLFVLGALAWWRLLQGKETARQAAASACREHGLSLMDDTVVLETLQLLGDGKSRTYGLRYRFDFARDGILRKGGSVLVSPGRPTTVIITTSSGQLIEEV